MRILGEDEFIVSCRRLRQVAGRLVVQLSVPVPPNACVKINRDDAFLLGLVLGCWRSGSSIFGVIELQQCLIGLAEFSAMRSTFGNGPEMHDAWNDHATIQSISHAAR